MMSPSALILPVGNAAAAAAANGSGGSVDSTDALAATGYINGEMVSKTLAAAAAARREEEEKDKANGNGAGRYSTDAVSDFDPILTTMQADSKIIQRIFMNLGPAIKETQQRHRLLQR